MPRLPRLILASGSPRRRQLLQTLGLRFEVRPVAVAEDLLPGEAPADAVLRLADEKASTAARPDELILAADTLVVLGNRVLGKPASADEARAMLKRLSGRHHTVHTGVALHDADSGQSAHSLETSRVRLARLSRREIDWYVATGEPLDKAGAYAVQGLGSLFVEAVEGNYSNVVGLPLPATYRLFRLLGYDLREFCSST